jgi:hypothetical protein
VEFVEGGGGVVVAAREGIEGGGWGKRRWRAGEDSGGQWRVLEGSGGSWTAVEGRGSAGST